MIDKAKVMVHSTWTILRNHYPQIQAATPAVKLNKRLKSTAGRAFIESVPQYIELSHDLFSLYPEEFQTDTIPHELAHLVAYTVFNDPGHGKGWKTVMCTIGVEPNRCHNMVNTLR